VSFEHLDDVGTRAFSPFPKGDDLSNLTQGQADRLGAAYKTEPLKDVRVVCPVSAGGPFGGLDDPDVFLVALRPNRTDTATQNT